ncbi:hypothetical protein [Nonlabens ulvanivorans]|uniref:hypothetical protein n=1 Tax=Nonlabens ulvanivorans TaxID=906888 RepID=UPI0032678C29
MNSQLSNKVDQIDFSKIDFYSDEKPFLTQRLQEQIKLEHDSVIYCISVDSLNHSEIINSEFKRAKDSKQNNRSFSKHNQVDSKCLYVGSSRAKTFVKRLREHLGYGSKSTYALHINQWLPSNIKISIEFFSINGKASISGYSALEFLEQALWMQEQPMFGKRSGLL